MTVRQLIDITLQATGAISLEELEVQNISGTSLEEATKLGTAPGTALVLGGQLSKAWLIAISK